MADQNHDPHLRRITRAFAGVPLAILVAWVFWPPFAGGTRHDASAPRGPSPSPGPTPLAHAPEPDPASVPQTVPIAGRVVDRENRPIANAKVYLDVDPDEPAGALTTAPPVRAETAADGRYQFALSRSELAAGLGARNYHRVALAAFAEGYGPAWTETLAPDDLAGNRRLQLVADAPITGHLIDPEGRPLPNITIRAVQIDATAIEDLAPWLDAPRVHPDEAPSRPFAMFTRVLSAGLARAIPPVATGPDGRFLLRGAGRERIVSILIEGPGIRTRILRVMTRTGPSSIIPAPRLRPGQMARSRDLVIHASGFEHVASPGRTVEGNVVAADTGRPVSGAVIRLRLDNRFPAEDPYPVLLGQFDQWTRSTTDPGGHYRLDGLPLGQPVALDARPGEDATYRPMTQELAVGLATGSARVDFPLARGVTVRGKVTDRTTGQPVPAVLRYIPALTNPDLRSPDDIRLFEPVATRPDGSFVLVALPGPGAVTATARDDRYLTADRVRADQPLLAGRFAVIQGITPPEQCQAFEPIAPGPTTQDWRCDLGLVPAPEPTIRILDPEGRPLAGAVVGGAATTDLIREGWWQARQLGVFRVTGLTRHRIRNLTIHHEGRRLVGTLAVRDAEPGPLAARLRPWGAVTGRLVDRDGQPRGGVTLGYRDVAPEPWTASQTLPRAVMTDSGGRFTLVGLMPDQEHTIKLVQRDQMTPPRVVGAPHSLMPGETRNLGDVREAPQ